VRDARKRVAGEGVPDVEQVDAARPEDPKRVTERGRRVREEGRSESGAFSVASSTVTAMVFTLANILVWDVALNWRRDSSLTRRHDGNTMEHRSVNETMNNGDAR